MAIGLSVTDNAAHDPARDRDRAQAGEGNGRAVRHSRATGRDAQVRVPAHGNICRFARVAAMTGRHSQIAVKQNEPVIASPAAVSAGKPIENKKDGFNRPQTADNPLALLRGL
jgi:hypothetical protein